MLSPELLVGLFPFHLAFADDLTIHSTGPSLRKMQPQLAVTSPAFELLKFCNPVNLTNFAALRDAAGQRAEIFVGDNKPHLFGQLAYCQVTGVVYFLGAPVIDQPEQLAALNLSLNDFAPYDTPPGIGSLHHTPNMPRGAVSEVSRVLTNAQSHSDRLRHTEQCLLEDLHAAADVYIRFQADGIVTDISCTKPQYLPAPQHTLIGRNLFDYSESVKNTVRHYAHLSSEGGMVRYDDVYEVNNRSVYVSVRIARTQDNQYLLVARDITERERQKQKLDYQATHDELTTLVNRRRFNECLSAAMAKRNDSDTRFAVVTVDLDDFKQVNDIYGHSAGDFILQVVAQRLNACLRSGDLAARLGGDEFCLLLDNIKAEYTISSLADRIVTSLNKPIGTPFGNISIGATLGMVMPTSEDDLDDVFRCADLALYEAKGNGKNGVAWYSPDLRSRHQRKMIMVEDLRVAIKSRAFSLEYQPIVDLRTKRVHAIEALARWDHPALGRVSPEVFIELAEEFNLIAPLSAVLFDIACRDLAWFRHSNALRSNTRGNDFQMNFNVSARELREPGFAEKIIAAARSYAVPPGCFTLELTESALIDNMARAKKELGLLKQQGVLIALDDFGKGYSSLSYLARLPVDVVKVDKVFVQGMLDADDHASIALIKAIVGLQESMGIKVVAEGIETGQQLQMLKRMSCAFGQGYFLGVPGARERTAALIVNGLDLKSLRVVS